MMMNDNLPVAKYEEEQEIIKSVKHGDFQQLIDLVGSDENLLKIRDQKQTSLLHHAVKCGDVNILQFILNFSLHCANDLISCTDDMNETALHWAARYDRSNFIKILLQNGIDSKILNVYGYAAIHVATQCNNGESLKAMIEHNVDVTERTNRNQTPLHIAAYYDHVEVFEILLINGASPCKFCVQGRRPLHVAAAAGSKQVMAFLLTNSERFGWKKDKLLIDGDNENYNPVHSAASSGDKETIDLCLKYGAKMDSKQADGSTAIHLLSAQGNLDSIKHVFEHYRNQAVHTLDMKNKQHHSPLHRAAMFDHYEIVEFLVEQGSKLDDVDDQQQTPLLLAASRGCWESLKILIKLGSNVKVKNKEGKNLLHLIVSRKVDLPQIESNEQVQAIAAFSNELLQKSDVIAMLNDKDLFGCTPLHYASQEGNVTSLTTFLQLGVSPREKTCQHQSPLHFACMFGRYMACRKLLNTPQGLNVINEKDCDGFTPLHLAAMNGHFEIVRLLLGRGAIMLRTNSGQSPAHVASANGYTKTVRVLFEFDLHLIDVVDENGDTALHIAAMEDQLAMISLLLDCKAAMKINWSNRTPFTLSIVNQCSNAANIFIEHDRWQEAMEIFYDHQQRFVSPFMLLIQHIPETCNMVLNRCVTTADVEIKSKDFWIHYNFKPITSPSQGDDKLERVNMMQDNNVAIEMEKIAEDKISLASAERDGFLVLDKMIELRRVECLQHPLVQAFLDHKWIVYGRRSRMQDLFFYFMTAVIVTYFVGSNLVENHQESDGSIFCRNKTNDSSITCTISPHQLSTSHYVLIALVLTLESIIFCRIFYWIFIKNAYKSTTDFTQLFLQSLDVFFLIGSLLYITPLLLGTAYHWQQNIGSTLVLLHWLHIFLISEYYIAGLYVRMFLEVLKTIIDALCTYWVLILAFTLNFYSFYRHEEHGMFSSPVSSFYSVLVILSGEIGWSGHFVDSLTDGISTTLHFDSYFIVVMLTFLVTMTIVLINLLIGLAVGDIAKVQNNAMLRSIETGVRWSKFFERSLTKAQLEKVCIDSLTVYPNHQNAEWKIFGNFFRTKTIWKTRVKDENASCINPLKIKLIQQEQKLRNIHKTVEKLHELIKVVVQHSEVTTKIE